MRSTSCSETAREVLDACVRGAPPAQLPRALLEDACGKALFGVLVEGLADRFEPSLADAYAHLFSQAVEFAAPEFDAARLVARYQRVRRTRPVTGDPKRVFVLSRITLGADIAVTSVVLAAAKQRFPGVPIVFVAPAKNQELFAGDPRIEPALITYRRGTLRERLAAWHDLRQIVGAEGSLLLDPDSRLTQLGLLPVCDEAQHHLFESRAYGGESGLTLAALTAQWAAETLGVHGAAPYLAVAPDDSAAPAAQGIAVSLGVGENADKRLPDPFEEELLKLLAATGLPLSIDQGAGGEEAERVARAVERSGVRARLWNGSFAGFSRIIASSRLYVGYDSAGQHAAAALGVPLISIFAGFPAPRMFDRWRPEGPRSQVIRVDRPDPDEVLAQVRRAMGLTGVVKFDNIKE